MMGETQAGYSAEAGTGGQPFDLDAVRARQTLRWRMATFAHWPAGTADADLAAACDEIERLRAERDALARQNARLMAGLQRIIVAFADGVLDNVDGLLDDTLDLYEEMGGEPPTEPAPEREESEA